MFNKNIGNNRFFLILALILCAFMLFVSFVFYSVKENKIITENEENQNITEYNYSDETNEKQILETETEEDTDEQSENVIETTAQNEKSINHLNIKNDTDAELDTPPIQQENAKIENNLTDFDENAQKLVKEKRYNEAIEEYNRLANEINNQKQLLIIYDALAKIYAINKKYGSALINLQKAYTIAPTPAREFMYARILYKTGQQEKAQTMINQILEREFALDK